MSIAHIFKKSALLFSLELYSCVPLSVGVIDLVHAIALAVSQHISFH